MRVRIAATVLCLCVLTVGVVAAGIFRKDQDVRSIKGFGAISVVEGRLMIGNTGAANALPENTKFKADRDRFGVYVPLGTQFRLDKGPYITYELDGEAPAVKTASEANLKAPWRFEVSTTGQVPLDAAFGGRSQRYTQTTEFRLQVMEGKRALWYLGVDRAAIKAYGEKVAKKGGKEDVPPPIWPLILVDDPGHALVFENRVSGTYRAAK